MTPDEIQEITNVVSDVLQSEESSNGPIYTLISVLVTATPLAFRYFKKAFVKAIEKVMESHTTEMKKIIDDLHGVKTEHKRLEQKVDENKTVIERLKEKC